MLFEAFSETFDGAATLITQVVHSELNTQTAVSAAL